MFMLLHKGNHPFIKRSDNWKDLIEKFKNPAFHGSIDRIKFRSGLSELFYFKDYFIILV